MTQEPAGFDAQRIGRWIERRFGISDYDVEVMSVGRSNLTFTITVDGRPRWVLRRPPLGHEGGSAHNVAREGRIMAALSDSAVPVPNVLDIVDDPEVLDVPFVFMDHCPGSPLNTPADWAELPETNRRDCAFAMVDALAAIHAVDIDAVGLSDLRRPGGLIERQLRRWLGQVEAIAMRETPAIHEVHDALLEAMPDPAGSPVGIAHGDFKPNNMIFSPTGAVNAVVDWELTAIGEVLTDLGYFVAMLTVPEEYTSIWVPRASDGFPHHGRTHRPLSGGQRPRSPRRRLLLRVRDVEARLHPRRRLHPPGDGEDGRPRPRSRSRRRRRRRPCPPSPRTPGEIMTSHVSGQSVIVTGAAGGIGAALAAELIDRGAAVVLADLSPSVADTAAALGSSAHAWTGDVSSVAGISELIAFADDRLGGVDAYFANAGIIGPGDARGLR